MILQNPYRLLGVFANDPLRVRIANTAKIRAFSKIGKEISFETDADGLLGKLQRTSESVEQANVLLFDNTRKAKFALFWFHKNNTIDDTTISHINLNTYLRFIIPDSDNNIYSDYINNAVLFLIGENFELAAKNYCKFIEYGSFLSSYKERIGLTQKEVDNKAVVRILILSLLEAYPEIEWWSLFLKNLVRPTVKRYVKSIFELQAIEHIKKSIASYSNSDRSSSSYVTSAHNLRRDTASDIRLLCPVEEGKQPSAEAQLVLDRLAEELLQESKNFYTAEKKINELSVYTTLQMVNFVMTLTHGSSIIDKASKFKTSLEKDIENLPPASIQQDITIIKQHINSFCAKSDDIHWSLQLIKDCVPNLIHIKNVLGSKSKHYIAISTKIADNALYNLDISVDRISNRNDSIVLNDISTLRNAWQLILNLEVLSLDPFFVSQKLNDKKSDVRDLLNSKNIAYSDIRADISLQTEEDVYNACNDYDSLLEFVKKNPTSQYVDNARFRIRKIEDEDYPKVVTVAALLTYKCKYPNCYNDNQVVEALNKLLLGDKYGTISDYLTVLGLYPNHPSRTEILRRIDYLKFMQWWTLYDYQQFVRNNPDSAYIKEAKVRIDEMLYTKCSTITDYNKFIIDYPSSPHYKDAMMKIEDMSYETAIKTRNYQSYLSCFPNGVHANELRSKQEYDIYCTCKSKRSYQQYLQQYPRGQYADLAKSNIKKINQRPFKILSGVAIICLLIWGISALITHNSDSSSNVTSSSSQISEEVNSENQETVPDNTSTSSVDLNDSSNDEATTNVRQANEPSEYDTYINNSLKTGSKPYGTQLGKSRSGSNYLKFKTSGSNDYVVIIKRASDNKYINHIYINGGDNATIYLPDGHFNIYFYSGEGWNPNKPKGELTGGFVSGESLQKDGPIELISGYGEYTLYPVQNGNLQLQSADADDVF